MEPRIFSIDDANTTLDEIVKPALDRLYRNLAAFRRAREESEVLRLIVDTGTDAANPDRASFRRSLDRVAATQAEMREDIEAIHTTGAVLKDLRLGLVDFFSIIDDRLVCLCWQRGEEKIRYWHTTDGGYRSRRPLGQRAGELDDDRH